MDKYLIFNCSDVTDLSWKWIAPHFNTYSWRFFTSAPKNFLEKHIKVPSLKSIRTAWQIINAVAKDKPDLLILHGPQLAFYTLLVAKIKRIKVKAVIYSFNFAVLPTGFKKWIMSRVFQITTKFIVYSNYEKDLYEKWFQIDPEKIKVIFWGVNPPEVESPEKPMFPKPYICAIGGNGRDYQTLLEAIKQLSYIHLILVVRPENLHKLEIPPNVTTLVNLELKKTMNILKFSNFMVLPLLHNKVPCGHVTLVSAMFLSIPFIITDSIGVSDYVHPEKNALVYTERSVEDLKKAISYLWDSQEKCKEFGANGKEFANKFCTEEATINQFSNLLKEIL